MLSDAKFYMSDGSAMIQKNADVALSEKMKQIELKRQEQEAQVHAADLGFCVFFRKCISAK